MLRVVAVLMLLTMPAMAQTAPQSSPFEQALARKLSVEIEVGLQTGAALISTQQDLAKAAARIKALEEKYEPKPAKPE